MSEETIPAGTRGLCPWCSGLTVERIAKGLWRCTGDVPDARFKGGTRECGWQVSTNWLFDLESDRDRHCTVMKPSGNVRELVEAGIWPERTEKAYLAMPVVAPIEGNRFVVPVSILETES